MQQTKQRIGSTSQFASPGFSTCQTLSYAVELGKLDEDNQGTSSRVTAAAESVGCIDLADAASLGVSLEALQSEVAEKAKEESRGNQGLDKDSTIQVCAETVGGTCASLPTLTTSPGYQNSVTVDCTVDLSTIGSLLGSVQVNQDPKCEAKQAFPKLVGRVDPEDGCGKNLSLVAFDSRTISRSLVPGPVSQHL